MKKHSRYKQYLLKTKNFYQQPIVGISTSLILTLAIVCLFAFFAIKPTLITIIKLNKELKEKQEVDKTLEKKINALKKAQAAYAQIIDDLSFVDRALPEKVNFNQAASQINFLTFSNNLTLLSASFGKFQLTSPDKDYPLDENKDKTIDAHALDFKISVNGSYTDIKNFIQELENIDRVVQIDSIVFSSKVGASQIKLQSDLSGKIFWLGK